MFLLVLFIVFVFGAVIIIILINNICSRAETTNAISMKELSLSRQMENAQFIMKLADLFVQLLLVYMLCVNKYFIKSLKAPYVVNAMFLHRHCFVIIITS